MNSISLGRLQKTTKRTIVVLPSRRVMTLIAILLLGIIGYLLAPADLALGNYEVEVAAEVEGERITAVYPFTLNHETTNNQTIIATQGGYRLTISGPSELEYSIGQQLRYSATLTDKAGHPVALPLNAYSSTISGPDNYQQSLPPTGQSDGSYIFTMRLPYRAKIAAGLLFVVAALWLTELVPLVAAALLIPVIVVLAGINDATTILQPFAHPIIILFLSGFLLAEGMKRTGIDRRVALTILSYASLKPAYLMLTLMIISAFFSMWMSNTASAAILIPIALAVVDKLPDPSENRAEGTGFRRALILGVAYAATIGGVGSAIGTPANMLALTLLNEFADTGFTFASWFAYGLPVTLIMLLVIWLYLLLTFRVRLGEAGQQLSHDSYTMELAEMGSTTRDQKIIGVVFLAVIGLWLTEGWHGVGTAVIGLAGAFTLFFTEAIKQEDLNAINWNALLTFGGSLAIGTVLVTTGVSDWIALQLTSLATLPPTLVILLVASLTLLTSAFISNTASAAMLIPIAIPLAQVLQLDPRLLVAIIAIGSSIDFALVVGTPPTMMAYATGLYSTKDIFRRGILLDIIGILVLTFVVVWLWQLFGVVSF